MNYHPDGGQVFFPTAKNAYVMILALPDDDCKPEDYVAFYFDGSCGLQIRERKTEIYETDRLKNINVQSNRRY